MFIFEKAPFPSCHASTLVETTPGKLMAAWFGGKAEKAKDVQIWAARFDGKTWTAPEVVGTEPGFPTWNPVLFRTPGGILKLWYKAGPDPMNWSGLVRTSADDGATWSKPEWLPAGFFGPVRAKPIALKDGTILAPTSVESHRTWTPFVDRSTDDGNTWTRSNAFPGSAGHHQIQPTLVEQGTDVIALMRSRNPPAVMRSKSTDGGKTFSRAEATALPNPSAGIDAVVDAAGAIVLIHNLSPIFRTPLSLAKSTDAGKTWTTLKNLETEPGEYSYPAIIALTSGELAFTYTWRRTHIKYGTFRS